jgi:hypothetical protein
MSDSVAGVGVPSFLPRPSARMLLDVMTGAENTEERVICALLERPARPRR